MPNLFAKVEVVFWRHKKFRRAGLAASGLWTAALTYLRENESTDGFIELDELAQCCGCGESEAGRLALKLVEVELFSAHLGGFYLLKYAEKNETKEDIVDNWEELERLYEEELPSGSAPRLYARIKELTR